MADGRDISGRLARTHAAIAEISPDQWNAVANPVGAPYNPFVSHEFLDALEKTGCVGAMTGWTPSHLTVETAGAFAAAAPVYLKGHSLGEYVFDQHWAEAYERSGGRYYPKVLCAAPFTPVPGPRLLAARQDDRVAIAAAIVELARAVGASSAHVNFIDKADSQALQSAGFLTRRGVQYHWNNCGYRTYEDFLAGLSSRKRKALRRERRLAQDGVTIRRLIGDQIDERCWDAFWGFYQDTGSRKWGRPYLTRAFFEQIAQSMTDRLMMVVALDGEQPIAGALNFIGGDALYGRYWGRSEDRPFLHFEVCYHQAIDFAIERGLERVEAGAQGEHKLARGYEPVATHSAHWIADAGFRAAIENYLEREQRQVAAEIEALGDYTPYRD